MQESWSFAYWCMYKSTSGQQPVTQCKHGWRGGGKRELEREQKREMEREREMERDKERNILAVVHP